nr:hypothetical protein [uncultured Brevundimonas sp.]
MNDRIILRGLAFTGPKVPTAEISFNDGLNVIWGASNTGKSFLVKSLDYMTGAGPEGLPAITERDGYDKAWLNVELGVGEQVQVARGLRGGDFEYREGWPSPDAAPQPNRLLQGEHRSAESWSAYLLAAIGLAHDLKIAKTQAGEKVTFTFRALAPYVFIEETPMLGDLSMINVSDGRSVTQDKNTLKFVLTGVDDSAQIKAPAIKDQHTGNRGKIELIDDMLRVARAELGDDVPPDIEDMVEALTDQMRDVQKEAYGAQSKLDGARASLALTRRELDAFDVALEELALTIERFGLLDRVYRSDTERLTSLLEGSEALLIGGSGPCPLCGAAEEHQRHDHGVEHVQTSRRAVTAELSKIAREQSELTATLVALTTQVSEIDDRREAMLAVQSHLEREIEAGLPAEADTRQRFEAASNAREALRERARLADRVSELEKHRQALERFKATRNNSGALVGLSGSSGLALATHVQGVLDEWRFPGAPKVTFSEATHEIQIDGKSRSANGKGVRALMHSAFKIGILKYCRAENLPHPGFLVLDSPLVSYREPHGRHGALGPDEAAVKASGLKDRFYAYLAAHKGDAQFIVIENDAPSGAVPDTQIVFAGPNSSGERAGLF